MTIEEMKSIKTERGYTYEQIAALSGVPLGTVQKILGGTTKFPRYDTVRALESFFALSAEEVAGMSSKTAYRASQGATEGSGYTVEDYYALTGERQAELIDGVFCDYSAPNMVRQRIIAELFSQLRNYTDLHDVSDMVPLMAPVALRLAGDERTLLRPDVMVLRGSDKIKRWGVLGAPEFVAEVLTAPVRRKDNIRKLAKYAETGVREYWMIDTEVRKLIIYPLEQDECLKVYKLEGRVPLGIFEDFFIDLKRIAELILDYPEEDDR